MKTRREQNPRLGSLPAQGCLEEATESGIPGICCLIPEPPFLGKHGFQLIDKQSCPGSMGGMLSLSQVSQLR